MERNSAQTRRRPFWMRKRWVIAAVLWLLLAYPLSVGPVAYVAARGWYLPGIEAEIAYWPLLQVLRNPGKYGAVCHYYREYVTLFEELGSRHRLGDSR